MNNTKYYHGYTLGGLILSVLLCVSCITIPTNISTSWVPGVKKRRTPPIDAFSLIKRYVTALPIACKGLKDKTKCKKIIDALPELTATGSGSGLLVMSDMGPGVITAAHVCSPGVPDEFKHENVTITIKVDIKFTVNVPTLGQYSAEIIRVDKESDLCLLKPDTVFTHPVPLASKPPIHGDVVYSIAAPYGISGPNMALIFRGFYSGKDSLPSTGKIVRFYTLPTKPGSSGSAVLNENWEVVGVIHTAFTNLETVGIGTGWQNVKDFLYPIKKTISKAE